MSCRDTSRRGRNEGLIRTTFDCPQTGIRHRERRDRARTAFAYLDFVRTGAHHMASILSLDLLSLVRRLDARSALAGFSSRVVVVVVVGPDDLYGKERPLG